MKDQDDEPTGVAASVPIPSTPLEPEPVPPVAVEGEPAAETTAEAAAAPKPSPLEAVLEEHPDLTGKQAKAVAEIVKTTNLSTADALVLARAKHPDVFGGTPATRQSVNTTPQRTGATQPKREPTPREAATQAYEQARAGLVTASGEQNRLDHAAATLRARRALQAQS